MFNRFDKVKYVGSKSEVMDEVGSNVGEVVAKIGGSTGYVVDFGLDQAFVVSASSLERARGIDSIVNLKPPKADYKPKGKPSKQSKDS